MSPGNDRGRPGERAASNVTAGDTQSVRQIPDTTADLDPFSWGVLADAWNIGRRLWWLRRARDFENAKPLPGEYHGRASREELSARWRWCDEVARACRARAELVGVDEELEHLLREAS
jgi:hypothetical protein